jgi:hypothetical protein
MAFACLPHKALGSARCHAHTAFLRNRIGLKAYDRLRGGDLTIRQRASVVEPRVERGALRLESSPNEAQRHLSAITDRRLNANLGRSSTRREFSERECSGTNDALRVVWM